MKNESESSENASPSEIPTPKERRRAGMLLLCSLLGITLAGGAVMAKFDEGGGGGTTQSTGGTTQFSAGATGPVHFTGTLDRNSVLMGGDGIVKMELVIEGDAPLTDKAAPRVPTDLVVVLDRSGSMSGVPITNAKAAIRNLIARLGPDDRFSLVSYSSDARKDIALTRASASAKRRWDSILGGIVAAGGTNMSSGIDLANAAAEGREQGHAARVVLLSDGHANEGDDSHSGLRARAARAIPGEWVFSAVGVGDGFDEQLMTSLADAGTGNFYYVQRSDDLGAVFEGEFASARETLASALRVTVKTADGVRVVDAAGYPLSSSLWSDPGSTLERSC